MGAHIATGEFLDWAGVEPFVGHVPTVRLRVPHPKLAKLHPAQIADLVEAASRREGEEIIQAVGDDDRELEADVFEELDDQHQREFLEDRPDAQIAEILSRMAPDDAADIVGELDEDRREPVLALLPVSHRVKVRALLGYDPAEAGGLMSPDFILLGGTTSAGDALDAVRQSEIAPELLSAVFVSSPRGSLEGSVPVTALLRADPGQRLDTLVRHEIPTLSPDASLRGGCAADGRLQPHLDPGRRRARADGGRRHRRRRARGDASARLAPALRPPRRGLNRLLCVSAPSGQFDGGPSTVRHASCPVGHPWPAASACPA